MRDSEWQNGARGYRFGPSRFLKILLVRIFMLRLMSLFRLGGVQNGAHGHYPRPFFVCFSSPNHSRRHRRRRGLFKPKRKRGSRIVTGIIYNLSLGTLPVPVIVMVDDIVKLPFQRLLPHWQ